MSDVANDSSKIDNASIPIREGRVKSSRTKRPNKRGQKKENKARSDSPPHLGFPNYFFAVRIDDPQIQGVIQAIQDHMVERENLLKHIVVSRNLAHITLGLLHVPNESALQRAVSAMDDCRAEIRDIVSQQNLDLKFEGIGNFVGEVVFAKVYPDENERILRGLAEFLSEQFVDYKSSSNFEYTPHLTMMKMSKIRKNFQLKKKLRRVDKSHFQHIKDMSFGLQIATSLQLLSMRSKAADGYYQCENEVVFDPGFAADEKSPEEKYADYLTNYILAGAACKSKEGAFAEMSKMSGSDGDTVAREDNNEENSSAK